MVKFRNPRRVAVVLLSVILFVSPCPIMTVRATVGAGSHSADMSIGVMAATSSNTSSFDFSINLNQHTMNVQLGGSVNQNFSLTYQGSTSFPVSLMANGFPPEVTIQFNPETCTPFCITTMNVSASSSAQQGTYQVNVTATGGGVSHSVIFTLNVGQISSATTTTMNSNTGTTTISTATITSTMNTNTTQPYFSVSCQPSSIVVGSSTTCTAVVQSSNGAAATGVVTWTGTTPEGISQTGFSPSQCTLSGGMCSVSYTATFQVPRVQLFASYSGDSSHPQSTAQFALNFTSTNATNTFTSGSFTSTFTGAITSGASTTTTSTSGLTLPLLPSFSITPLVPIAIMAAMIAVAVGMSVSWLRVKGGREPLQAKSETDGAGSKEGSV